VLAGCSSGGSAAVSGSSSGAAPKPGDISGSLDFAWWGSQTRNDKTTKIMSMFEQKYPKVKLSGQPDGNYTDYWQKLTVQAAAKNMVCVPSMQNTYMAQYDTRGALMPLDDLVKSGAIDISKLPKSIVAGGKGPDGKLYMIGTAAATTTLVYNPVMADKYGIPAPPKDMTWDSYAQWLLAAQPKLPKGVYAADLQGGQYAIAFAWIRSHGYDVFTKSSAGGYKLGFPKSTLIDFWNWWNPLIKAGAVTPPGMMAEEPTTSGQYYDAQAKVLSEVDTSNASADDAALAAIGGGKVVPINFPLGPKGKSGEVMDLSGLSISANCKNVDAAAAFINYWANNPDAAAVYSSDNGAVTNKDLLATQTASTELAEPIKTSLDFLKGLFTANRPVAFYPPGYSGIVTLLTSTYSNVAFEKQSPKEAADSFFATANQDLAG
jgi:multiple sugar transport system substrate-binding protein